jgi:hypothetical protein
VTTATPAKDLAAFVVCEDGHEYSQRFERLLGSAFHFERAGDFNQAALAARGSAVVGLLFDLDFRRTPADALVDESGQTQPDRSASERQRLAVVQGIFILRALRAAGVRLPALLFADLDDPAQITFLESSLAPLQIVPSSAGLPQIARAMGEIASAHRK